VSRGGPSHPQVSPSENAVADPSGQARYHRSLAVYEEYQLLFREEPSTALEAEELFEGVGDAVRGEGEAGREKGWDNCIGTE